MIEGDLVRLRARRPDDNAHARRWYADPETTRYLLMTYPPPPEPYAVPAEPLAFGGTPMTVEDKETGTPIGTAGLMAGSAEHRRAVAFVVIGDAAYRGRGYGLDLIRTLCRFGFDGMNLAKVELEVLADNERAIRTYERAGFVREVHRKRARWFEGAWHDEYLMGLLREELR